VPENRLNGAGKSVGSKNRQTVKLQGFEERFAISGISVTA
jgi:hypothetical protein